MAGISGFLRTLLLRDPARISRRACAAGHRTDRRGSLWRRDHPTGNAHTAPRQPPQGGDAQLCQMRGRKAVSPARTGRRDRRRSAPDRRRPSSALGKLMALTKAQLKKIALSFPEALEKTSYGNPAFFIAKKFFTRHRSEDDSIVLIVDSIDERDMMMEADPKTFFITDHYK